MTTTVSSSAKPNPQIDKAALQRRQIQGLNAISGFTRPDGNAQYLALKGRLAHYLNDPYTPVRSRQAKTDHVTFAFVGGGFAGLVTGAQPR